MIFLVGGYDENAAYGRVFELHIPHTPQPIELSAGEGNFGAFWGGQRDYTDRLMQGFASGLPALIAQRFNIAADKQQELTDFLKQQFQVRIPYQFLPLQDCVDLSIFLIRTTISLQTWLVDIRGVGGHIDVATITKTDGFKSIQHKTIQGERAK